MATASSEHTVHLAVFGKHPGWDDHIEEIGLDIPEFVTARRLLYSEGVAGNIDSGAWDRLEEGKLLPAFKHNFFWRIGGQWIVGRMWSSRDGKGRSKYPMIVCGRIDGASAAFAARHIVPALMRFEESVKATTLADDVKRAAAQARAELAQASNAARAVEGDDADLLRRLVDHPNLMPGEDPTVAFERVMYEIEREMQGFRRQSAMSRAKQEPAGQHMRVPRCFEAPGEDARAWTALLDRNIDRATGVLVVEPDDADFVDVLVGAPAVGHIFCLRATRAGLGLATQVPYTIDPDFAAIVRAKRESYRRSEQDASSKKVLTSVDGDAKSGSSKLKWIVIGGGAIVGIIAGVMVFSGGGAEQGGSDTPKKAEPQPTPAPTQDSRSVIEKPKSPPERPAAQAPVAPPTQPAPVAPTVDKPTEISKSPKTFDPADPRASWRTPARLAEIAAQFDGRSAIHSVDAPREAATMREALRNASEILDEALAIEYPSGRIVIELTMKKLEERLGEIDRAAASLEQRIVESAKSVGGSPKLAIPAMNDAWRKWFDSLDFSKGSKFIQDRVGAASTDFAAMEVELARALSADASSVGVDAQSLRIAAAEAVAMRAGRGDFESALAEAKSFASRIDGANALVAKAAKLRAMLDAGMSLGEVDGDMTIERATGDVRASEALSLLPGACADLLATVDALAALAAERDSNVLLQNITKGGAYSIAAMRRLASPEVKLTGAQLADVSAAFVGPVADAIKTVGEKTGPSRGRIVSDAMASSANAVWLNAGESLGSTDAGLASLEQASRNLGGELWESASPRVRFNRALSMLRAADAPQAGEAALEVLARGADLSASEQAAAKVLIDALTALKPVRKAADLSQVGPATAGWKLVESDETRAVYEKGSRGGAPVRLEFRAVKSASGGKSMVLTTEVSVRMASVMVADANALTPKVAAMVGWRFSGESTDSRSGPRTWTWSGSESAQELVPINAVGASQGWIRGAESWIGNSLPQSNPKPTWDSPMQYIGLPGALLLARAAGCVLPTAEEFASAVEMSGAAAESNVRDATWSAVAGSWLSVNQSGTGTCPTNADAFSGSIAAGTTPATVRSDSDGVVWFDRVDSGTGLFRNLTGNVAEYVAAGTSEMQTLATTQVEALIRLREAPVAIVGASALSGPEVKPSEGVRMKTFSGRGYSDVGFRLAFGLEEAQGPMEWDTNALKRVAGDMSYLVGGS